MDKDYDIITERLLLQPYWVIDFLPKQVPQDSRGQFFAVEQYYLTGKRHERLCRQLADVVLKLNCYHDLTVNHGGDEWINNPAPEVLAAWIIESLHHGHLCALAVTHTLPSTTRRPTCCNSPSNSPPQQASTCGNPTKINLKTLRKISLRKFSQYND